MLTAALIVLFWLSLFLLVYSYALYPLILSLFAKLFGRPARTDETVFPSVGVVVPVYNEETVVKQKVENLLAMEYPAGRLSVWVGSDCSSDATHDIVKAMADPRVHLWVAERRGGKTEVINKLALRVDADVLMFTDANTMHRPDSLKKMVRWYADPSVGGVGGHIEHVCANRELEEVLYRSFESRQKMLESRLHSTISAFGGFYSVRKQAFSPIHYNAYSNDDVIIPMNVIRRGFRMIFDPAAVSEEETTESIRIEFSRRIRIGAGNFQAFSWLLDFLNPLKGWPWFCYVSHKVTRWFSPFFILGALISGILLALLHGPFFYTVLLFAGLAGLALALVYSFAPIPFIRPLYYFISMNAALLAGFFRFLGGIRSAAWSRTSRGSEK
ncbi:MAG TPA: glycosyltransferase family 2 protein [Chitinivibrionales bacterium]|nr:glycosyltransferase family 2 protein [Chitinivibrionales bacterium]